jgi:hypothetical protein
MDWDVALHDERNMVNPIGLYDLDRKPHPVAAAYRQIIQEFARQLPASRSAESGQAEGMFAPHSSARPSHGSPR